MVVTTKEIEDRLREQLNELRNSYRQAVIESRWARRVRTRTILVFEVASAAFAVPAENLLEVVSAKGLVAVPCGPKHIAGAITHRQELVCVLDLKTLLDMPDADVANNRRILVLRPASNQWALLAESVIGIHKINPARLNASTAHEQNNSIISDNIVIDGRPVAMLDIEALASVTTSGLNEKTVY
jgi:chemotaxis signal transduction protein